MELKTISAYNLVRDQVIPKVGMQVLHWNIPYLIGEVSVDINEYGFPTFYRMQLTDRSDDTIYTVFFGLNKQTRFNDCYVFDVYDDSVDGYIISGVFYRTQDST